MSEVEVSKEKLSTCGHNAGKGPRVGGAVFLQDLAVTFLRSVTFDTVLASTQAAFVDGKGTGIRCIRSGLEPAHIVHSWP